MKSTARENKSSFQDALHIFWDWRQASISVEVSFFGKSRSTETVRVSIDGLVTLVDPEGIVTVSGDGREIELDLRGCEFARARQASGHPEVFNALDPDSVLQVRFPHGEVCLAFPYRRVARLPGSQRRAENGLEWLRNKLSASTGRNGLTYAGLKGRAISGVGENEDRPKRGRGIEGVRLFPVLALVLAAGLPALVPTPMAVPSLLSELGLAPISLSNPGAQVWVIGQVGNYYCHGGVLFGRRPGQLMKQSDALTLSYQPALGRYCGSDGSARAARSTGELSYLRNLSKAAACSSRSSSLARLVRPLRRADRRPIRRRHRQFRLPAPAPRLGGVFAGRVRLGCRSLRVGQCRLRRRGLFASAPPAMPKARHRRQARFPVPHAPALRTGIFST